MPCTKNCLHITFCIFAFYFFTGTTSSQHCQANWAQDIYCLPGLNGEVYASAVWNDGTGDALYVGGDFTIAGCNTDAVNIARWRGDKWESISTPEHSVVSGPIHAMEVFDGGDGPLLFVGGEFEFAGNVPVYNVAMWDGDQWSPLEDLNGIGIPNCGFSGCIVPIHAMKVFDDGSGPSLYIAGEFSFAGGQQITNIARWNGAEWSYLTNQSMNGMIYDLEVYDDGAGSALYIAGRFSSIGGSPFDNVAKWDGSDWSPLAGLMGEGVDGLAAYAIETFDDGSGEALYVGGHFVSAGGYPVDRIAKWDGLDWSVLPDPDGGTFGGNQAGASIRSLAAFDSGHDSMLVAGGYFTSINGGTVNRVASWDGVEWSPLQHSDSNIGLSSGALPYVHHLNPFMLDGQRNLFIGGRFETAGGYHATNAALWDGSELSAISTPASAGADSRIQGLTTFDDGFSTALIAGGNFKSIGDTQSKYIAAWNGAEWRPLDGPNGYGLSSEVFAVVTHDDGSGPALYAGGRFTFADGINVNRVAKWDGSQWSPLISSNGSAGIGNSYVQTMASYDDGNGAALYVGGFFTQAGGSSARYIAKWNGIDWESLLSGTNDPVYAMTVFDDGTGSALYVGGSFTHANGVWTGSVARWDGSEWTNLFGSSGFATNGRVYALEVYDDGTGPALFAAGEYSTADGKTVNSIAKWDGTDWHPLQGSSGTGVTYRKIDSMAVFDDGTGPCLYIGGDFTRAGGIEVNHIAKWDGSEWHAIQGPDDVGAGMHFSEVVRTLHTHVVDSEAVLAVGGDFLSVGGVVSERVAILKSCEQPCPADTNNDGILTPADFTAWINAYNNDLAECDQNADGLCNAGDFTAWIINYNSGC